MAVSNGQAQLGTDLSIKREEHIRMVNVSYGMGLCFEDPQLAAAFPFE
jgi:hypothetical protein